MEIASGAKNKEFFLFLVTISFWSAGLLSAVRKANAKEPLRAAYCLQSYAVREGPILLFAVRFYECGEDVCSQAHSAEARRGRLSDDAVAAISH